MLVRIFETKNTHSVTEVNDCFDARESTLPRIGFARNSTWETQHPIRDEDRVLNLYDSLDSNGEYLEVS